MRSGERSIGTTTDDRRGQADDQIDDQADDPVPVPDTCTLPMGSDTTKGPLAVRRRGFGLPGPGPDTWPMGMNPYRPHRRRPSDYVLVAAALLVVLGLVTWALHG